MENEGNMWQYEDLAQDTVSVKVTTGESKSQEKKKDAVKMEKNGNISTEIERFQLERTSYCSTKIINMDAGSLFPIKKSPSLSKSSEPEFTFGLQPPPSPRSARDLYGYFEFAFTISYFKFNRIYSKG